MKPLKLTIEGIKSFTEPQTVDFSLLGRSNIFVIAGVTGAGKTTVLDCIILALYGGIKGDGLKSDEYINLRSDKGAVTLEFKAEKNGVPALYSVSRTFYRGNRGAKAVLSDLTSGVVICEGADKVNAEIARIIGLEFDDFTKVVILQQGKYNEFLKATAAKRTELVGSLFRLEKYRNLYQKARAEKGRADASLAALDEYLGGKKQLTAAALRGKESELKQLSERLEGLDSEIETLRTLNEKYARERMNYEEYKKTLESLKAAKKEFQSADEALKDFDKADDAKASETLLKQATEALGALQQRLKAIADSGALNDMTRQAKRDLEKKREKYKETARQKEKQLADAEEADRKKELCRSEIAALADMIEDSGIGADVKDITAARAERLLGDARLLKAESESADKAYAAAKEETEKKRRESAEAKERAQRAEKNCERALSEYQAAVAEAEKAETLLDKARRENAAYSLALSLERGDKCPVCGATLTEKPHIGHTDGAEALEEGRARAREEAEKRRALLTEVQKEAAAAAAACESEEKALEACKKTEKECRLKAEKTARPKRASFAEIESALAKIAKTAEEGEKAEKKRADLIALSRQTDVQLKSLVSEGETLAKSLKSMEEQLFAVLGTDDYDAALAAARNEEAVLKTRREDLDNRIKQAEKERRAKEAARSAALGAYSSLLEREEKTRCEEPDEEAAEKTRAAASKAEKTRAESKARTEVLKAEIEEDRKELAIKREKEKSRKALGERARNLEILMKMFKGDKFTEFIAQEYIEDFSSDASEILNRTSGGCYTMGYDADKAEFYVCDFRAGNMRRSTGTLSGGETFLASLALAIAVSKSIAAKNTSGLKFDFLFLDEGFGTLHKDAIGVVERALRLLSTETLVGVVTHRSELSELIPDKLLVESATESEGSKVKVVS